MADLLAAEGTTDERRSRLAGAFNEWGVTCRVEGGAQDGVAKTMLGGTVSVGMVSLLRGRCSGPAGYQGRPWSTIVLDSVISATAARGPSLPMPLPLRPP